MLCVLTEANGKKFEGHVLKCALKTMKLVSKNGVFITDNLDDLANFLNSFEKKESKKIVK